ncbi:protein DDI1 homolog 2 isoform X2 [Centruroides vittatus]|uniref:protein DDI1 homolog 2-like isoform X1 n=1 Tax=Centruroides sculpturatus TaxID=218467 RepID=UPI000C6EDEE3|nr:protein DDI1 homolog 2-like isoform X1 [Centruroides sculpturatus]
MKVTVTTLSDDIFTLDVSDDMELVDLKALCEYESGIGSQEIVVMHEGRPLLDDKKDLKTYGIKEGDVLLIQQIVQQRMSQDSVNQQPGLPLQLDFSGLQLPQTSRPEDDPVYLKEMLLSHPEQLALLKHNNPRLADALLSGDIERFTSVLREQQKDRAEKDRQRIRIMNADPFDPEAQRMIAEEIRQQNVDSNMEAAMEYHPESFGQVIMLYVNCKVNGHPVKAFIDSGAQTTIMSQACAERCSIMRLVDNRWAGVAKGVGTQKIIGRVHLVQIQIENDFLTSSFSILEDQPMDMLLGLDMLKRHQCSIDLKKNKLVIGTTGTETPFLSENELPECARLQIPQILNVPANSLQEQEDRQLAEALARSAEDGNVQNASPSPSTVKSQRISLEHKATSSSCPGSQPADNFTDNDVQSLVNLGFPRQQVVEELRNFNGDTTQAMASLFAKSLKLP